MTWQLQEALLAHRFAVPFAKGGTGKGFVTTDASEMLWVPLLSKRCHAAAGNGSTTLGTHLSTHSPFTTDRLFHSTTHRSKQLVVVHVAIRLSFAFKERTTGKGLLTVRTHYKAQVRK